MNLQELNEKIIEWAKERGFDKEATIEGQTIKVIEECAELIQGISKNNIDLIKDSIGDVYVAMKIRDWLVCGSIYGKYKPMYKENEETTRLAMINNLAEIMLKVSGPSLMQTSMSDLLYDRLNTISFQYDLSLEECVEYAYNEIKDRKGKMVNGVFVKEEDLKN